MLSPRPTTTEKVRLRLALGAAALCAAFAARGADSIAPDARAESGTGGAMGGALGSYPFTREASGTSWQPDVSEHAGIHLMEGDWMVMTHALLNGVDDWQQGPRGADKTFLSGMLMAAAMRPVTQQDTIRVRAMLSPDPLMGKSGLPLLLASGETANGVTPLVDRQHPHDLFMELSGSESHALTLTDSVFLYAGLPGEPAFGPPAFMHRLSIEDSPEPPITHHWLDSTHISFGVVTVGWVHADWKLEASRFRGREPDQFRYNIETGRLDSSALRLSWNPSETLSLQASWAQLTSPEQLHPTENQRKLSVSAIYTRSLGSQSWWSTTVAWGRRSSEHGPLDAFAVESALRANAHWTVFFRAERECNDEFVLIGNLPGPAYTVGKASIGAVRDFRLAQHVSLGIGGLYATNFLPPPLTPVYGNDPAGAMAFVRLKVD
jgi:hypothetical protein